MSLCTILFLLISTTRKEPQRRTGNRTLSCQWVILVIWWYMGDSYNMWLQDPSKSGCPYFHSSSYTLESYYLSNLFNVDQALCSLLGCYPWQRVYHLVVLKTRVTNFNDLKSNKLASFFLLNLCLTFLQYYHNLLAVNCLGLKNCLW